MRHRKPRRIVTKAVKLTTHNESIISYTEYLNDTTKCGVSSKVSSLQKKMLYAVILVFMPIIVYNLYEIFIPLDRIRSCEINFSSREKRISSIGTRFFPVGENFFPVGRDSLHVTRDTRLLTFS